MALVPIGTARAARITAGVAHRVPGAHRREPALLRALRRGVYRLTTRPLSRGQRSIWLTVHILCAVSWIGWLMASLALGIGLATWPVDASAVGSLNRLIRAVTQWVLIPSVAGSLVSGSVLARAYRRAPPRWLLAKLYLTLSVVALGALVTLSRVSAPAYTAPARTGGLLILLSVVVLSVMRPNGRRARRSATSVTTIITATAVVPPPPAPDPQRPGHHDE